MTTRPCIAVVCLLAIFATSRPVFADQETAVLEIQNRTPFELTTKYGYGQKWLDAKDTPPNGTMKTPIWVAPGATFVWVVNGNGMSGATAIRFDDKSGDRLKHFRCVWTGHGWEQP